jgi:hypothetical protein
MSIENFTHRRPVGDPTDNAGNAQQKRFESREIAGDVDRQTLCPREAGVRRARVFL